MLVRKLFILGFLAGTDFFYFGYTCVILVLYHQHVHLLRDHHQVSSDVIS